MASPSPLVFLLYPAGHQPDVPIGAWSRSRFLPVKGEFFLATVACYAPGLGFL